MPIFSVRDVGKYGIVTDPDSYDLPIEAFSNGVNVRFRADKVTRGPVWRNGLNTGSIGPVSGVSPRFIQGFTPVTGQDAIFIGYLNGRVTKFTPGTGEADFSISGYSPVSLEATWSACHLGNVSYINRSDRNPWYLLPSAGQFADLGLASGTQPWGGSGGPWSCQILRAFNSALVALNVTKNGVNFPTLVKTSSFAQNATVPQSWDFTQANTSAVENTLAEMEGQILDGLKLGNVFFIYGLNEVWAMQASGDTFIYNFTQAFTNRGVINTNCVIEINRRHYVFGIDDIWMHDGVSQQSICDGRTREYIFSGLNVKYASRCFVVHNAPLKELMFCYVSGDRLAQWQSGANTGCNRSATYNYADDCWTFDDCPMVYSGSRANVNSLLSYSNANISYAQIGGSYKDQEDTEAKNTIFVGDSYSVTGTTTQQVGNLGPSVLTPSVYAFDPAGPLSQVSWAIDLNATQNMYLERDGIDLDQVGADLKGYKLAKSIIPQGRLDPQFLQPMEYILGAADYFNQTPTFDNYLTWDGNSLYKLDFNIAGRFLAMHILYPDYHFASISGYDVELEQLADR